jgi:hypothetical protein
MLDRLQDYFLEEPRRVTDLGRLVLWVALVPFIAGVAVAAYSGVLASLRTLAPQAPSANVGAQQLFPGLPTFWVPESGAAFVVVIVLAVSGVGLVRYGRQLERLLR